MHRSYLLGGHELMSASGNHPWLFLRASVVNLLFMYL
jgi:hypothetical protein